MRGYTIVELVVVLVILGLLLGFGLFAGFVVQKLTGTYDHSYLTLVFILPGTMLATVGVGVGVVLMGKQYSDWRCKRKRQRNMPIWVK